jgi:hypothetical protein
MNDVVTAICTERPRLLVYGSPAFVPATTVNATRMDAIPFPGISGGIEWRIRFDIPRIDLFQQTAPLPPELTLPAGALSVHVACELCLDCRRLRIGPRPPKLRLEDRKREHEGERGERLDDHLDVHSHDRQPLREATCCRFDVFVIGRLERVATSAGEDAVAVAVDAVEVVDIEPDEVEQVVECLLFMILQAVMSTIRVPLEALRVGAFQLSVTEGPLIEDDQVKARGAF